ncbi:MAG: AAA family ATPase [Ectothiorhodospiraceae bacterium]|nr:AAA family ATPase [Ectothiorhodospiraceae bacterium]
MSPTDRSGYFYDGNPVKAPEAPVDLPPPLVDDLKDPLGYIAGDDLVDAVHVAITLGQPLLLTGEPGTGKTRLAYALAAALGLEPVLECFVKSTTAAGDLFYTFDEVGRFRDAQDVDARGAPLTRYIAYNGLGKAILFAGGPDAKLDLLPGGRRDKSTPTRFVDLLPREQFPARERQRSVVLVDEIDKAPRDVPNDMLNEIDDMAFDVTELGVRVKAPRDHRPIVIMTSNSEKNLPDAFLRRCAFFDIPFPDDDTLRKIIDHRIQALRGGGPLLDDALALFARLRAREAALRKRPGTAELLGWLLLLVRDAGLGASDRLPPGGDVTLRYLSALVKTREDLARARDLARGRA